jgi:Ni/Fe-hydrogenase 1 B-type cytochrome subunit
MFNGNHFERWRNFIPTGKAYFKDFWQVVKIDVLLKKNTLHFAIGHNALAGFSYLVLFITMLVMIITGFALYSDMSMSWFPKLFSWVTQLLGGDIMVRSIHHIATWIFILFTIVHVYLVFFHDYVEGRGEISSMGGGWKFVSAELLDKHLNEKK